RLPFRSPTRLWVVLSLGVMIVLGLVAGCRRWGRSGEEVTGGRTRSGTVRYHCPMHPTYVTDRPSDCPICYMALVPVESAEQEFAGSVAGRVTIRLSPEKQQLVGLTTAVVEKRRLAPTIRAVGRVEYAEPNVAWISTRVGGWIEKLHVNTTGSVVKKGEPLLEIYSPELLAAQREYLVAAGEAKAAARQRLVLLGVTEDQITELDRSGQARATLAVVSPRDGYVVEKLAVAGRYVMPGDNLYRVADLSRVWVLAEVYEREASCVRRGQPVVVTGFDGGQRSATGAVSFIYPNIEPQTRTVTVRVELESTAGEWKPGMYVTVEVETGSDEVLAVPASAVLDTGLRQLAFVDAGDGHLEPREVRIGMRTDDWWEVLDGLAEGERVVTRGLFLVDSESQLKAAVLGMGAGRETAEHAH
ncbi:MAG: efflux RND transporter periplasmic adaptor subunit, partial [Verrucomicrobiae bacterium]|nr:efflux RND transporter periplasmic adaptor subunit [Verrucomicrobiae bacterium]